MKSDAQLNAYVKRGLSEIHWYTNKVSHFILIEKLLQSPYKIFIMNVLERVFQKNYANFIYKSIAEVDLQVPEFLKDHKIPAPRKEFIAKLIVTRLDELKKLVNA